MNNFGEVGLTLYYNTRLHMLTIFKLSISSFGYDQDSVWLHEQVGDPSGCHQYRNTVNVYCPGSSFRITLQLYPSLDAVNPLSLQWSTSQF